MADKDDFAFDEEEETGFDSGQESEDWGEFEPEKKGGSKRLIYLFVLLLVLAGGAAYLFLLAPADGPSPPVQVVNVTRKPITAPMPKPIEAPQPANAPAPAEQPVVTEQVTSTPVAASTSAAPTASTAVPEKPAAAESAVTPPVATRAPARQPAEPETKLFASKPQSTPVAAGTYTISAGAYAMQSSVDRAVKKIRQLGYDPELQTITRKVEMTRLLVGVYPSANADQKLRQIKAVSPGAFSLNKGAQTAVYAGSFLVLDKARVFADTILTENGIRVTEEPTKIDQSLQRVVFGSFASREDAAKVAREAAGKGLEAMPVRK